MPYFFKSNSYKFSLEFPKTILYLLILLSGNLKSQGVMAKVSGHHIAALDFLNTYTSTKNRISNPNPTACGLTNTADSWYKENNISVKGLLSGAVLVTDWWLLFNEPTENYNFQWKSSGKYQIEYFNKDGKQVYTTISKDMLSKYPDLLKRFNALKPLDVKFQINWRIGGHTDDDKDKFKKSYKIMGDIGSAMPHVKSDFNTKINNGLLFEASGVEPLSVPGIRPGKGKDFFGLAPSYNDQKFKEILAYWNISKGHVINNFVVTQMRWPVAEMKSIAEKLEAYEKGTEPSPKDQIKKADSIPLTNKTKGIDPFWEDAIVEEENHELVIYFENNKYGFKDNNGKVIIPAKFFSPTYFKKNKIIIDCEKDPSRSIYARFYKNIWIYSIKGTQLYHVENVYYETLRFTNSSNPSEWELKHILLEKNKVAFIIDIVSLKKIFEIKINNNSENCSIFDGPGTKSCNTSSNCMDKSCFSIKQNREGEQKGWYSYKVDYYSIQTSGNVQFICNDIKRFGGD